MPTLNWIGKDKVVNHHLDVTFRTLKEKYRYGDPESAGQNKIIHGDNLEALKSLLPEYEGKIKCIYIDPPYNTGNEGWVYNDNVNHPKIKKWLGDVVGKEGEDLTRHDKWLCMMYPRLKLLHRLLSEDGAIFISIDDNEIATLRLLIDEIFGRSSFIANICWQKKQSPQNDATYFSDMHDFILVYAKSQKRYRTDPLGWQMNRLPRSDKQTTRFKNPDNDKRGPWISADLTSNKTKYERPNLYFPIFDPTSGKEYWPSESRVWAYEKLTIDDLVDEGRIYFGGKRAVPRLKRFLAELNEGIVPSTWWPRQEVGDNQTGRREYRSIVTKANLDFATPKPSVLIRQIIQLASKEDDIILDSFAGSGTTAHAVLNLNKEDGGNRKFILVELEDYADSITAERVKRVIDGYGEGKNAVEGTGGGFTFHELGDPLFFPDGSVNDFLGIDHLRRYIWFTETRSTLPVTTESKNPHFIASLDGTSYYLMHQPDGLGTLDFEFLKTVDKKDEQYVIYADRCHIDEELLRRHSVIFKKIPRDIVRF
jgi:adenine-specific DNA-methyltransferase